jgi:predicted dinucleotide-utilizing enzyme
MDLEVLDQKNQSLQEVKVLRHFEEMKVSFEVVIVYEKEKEEEKKREEEREEEEQSSVQAHLSNVL